MIKKLLYNIKLSKYPNDENFLYNIDAINFIIFSTFFLMKLFANSNEYYIDATFMKSPRKYYQT